MRTMPRLLSCGLVALLVLTLVVSNVKSVAAATADAAFDATWRRTDWPVHDGEVGRTWMWGEEVSIIRREYYAGASGDVRDVQYFDKSRMEINNPDADPDSIWYVTNGLLVVELMTGRLQTGDDAFEDRNPAQVNVAGDLDDPDSPTYATFATVTGSPPLPFDQPITQQIDRDGNITSDPALADYGVEVEQLDPVTGHAIAGPFWAFMNSEGIVYEGSIYGGGEYFVDALFENAYFATGRPVTEAYWAEVDVAGTPKQVLTQAFERRVLTFTPDNPDGWEVEAGNVGQHYYAWRYGEMEANYQFAGVVDGPRHPESPRGIALGPDGAIFVADSGNDVILEYDASGQLLAILRGPSGLEGVADGLAGPNGIDVDEAGNVYVADYGNHRILKLDPEGQVLLAIDERGAEAGQLDYPADVKLDGDGNIYVADSWNHRVQKFAPDGAFLAQFGGEEGQAPGQMDNPRGLAIGLDGTVYVADSNNNRVQLFAPDTTYLSHFDLGGVAWPHGIVVAPDGTLYVADTMRDRVLHYDTGGAYLGDVPGSFDGPAYLALDVEGRFYITDSDNNRVTILEANGAPVEMFPDPALGLLGPQAAAVDASGQIYIVDSDRDELRIYDAPGSLIDAVLVGNLVDGTHDPVDVAIGPDGSVYVLNAFTAQVFVYTAAGSLDRSIFIGDVGPENLGSASGIALDADGNLYVSHAGWYHPGSFVQPEIEAAAGISKFGPDGTLIDHWDFGVPGSTLFGNDVVVSGDVVYADTRYGIATFDLDGNTLDIWEFGTLAGLAADSEGNVYTVEDAPRDDATIRKYTAEGVLMAEWGGGDTGVGEINSPLDITIGDDGSVYVTDGLISTVLIFEAG